MTVSTIYAPIEYAGDASTVAFPVPWMFFETDDLRLTKINDATDAETAVVTFTTTGDGEPTGGTVTLPAPLGTGYTLRIERRTDRTQEMDLQPQGRFASETIERSVDKLTLIVQELEESIGTGGTGSGTAIETIVTDDPSKVEIVKTGTEVTINVLATNPTGPAGGDLAGTYPDPILVQGTGVGSLLVEIETDFAWSGWAGGSTLGGRGIAAGYAWFGEPGSQVHLPVWGANDAYATIYWTRDYWATTVTDSSLAGIIGVGTLNVKPPCMAYVLISGVWCWVLTSDSDGRWWYAPDVEASYNADGSVKVAAWVAGTTATRVMADIAQSTFEGATCMVGNHGYIIRTTNWTSWTDAHNTGGPVIGGIATDNAGTWIAVERDTGLPIRSTDGGLTWSNPTIFKRTGESGAYASASTLIPAGAVVHGNGVWLVTGAASYAYSPDGLYWTVENSALGAFYGVGFDGVRYFATNPNNGTDPAIIYQLLVSSIPFHRQVVAERGLVVGGDAYLKDLPGATGIGTDQNGKTYDMELGDSSDPSKGAGRVGYRGETVADALDVYFGPTTHVGTVSHDLGLTTARMCAANGILYVCDYSSHRISALDVTTPTSPVYIGSVTVGGDPRHCEVVGDFLIVISMASDQMHVVRITDPANMAVEASYTVGTDPKMCCVVGRNIYVVRSGAVERWEIQSLPLREGVDASTISIVKTGEVTVPADCYAIDYSQDVLAVVGGNTKLVLIIASLFADAYKIEYTIPGSSHGTCKWYGRHLFVANRDDSNVLHYDLSDLGVLAVAGHIAGVVKAEELTIVGDLMYVPSLTDPGVDAVLYTIDLSDLSAITIINESASMPGAGFTAVWQDALYVSTHFGPPNLDVYRIPPGKKAEGAPLTQGQEVFFHSVRVAADVSNVKTVDTNYAVTGFEGHVRVGGAASITLTLPNPAALPHGTRLDITGVDPNCVVTVSSAYLGWSGRLLPGRGISLMATEFGGVYQWDPIGIYASDSVRYKTVTSASYTCDGSEQLLRMGGAGAGQTCNLADPATVGGYPITIKSVDATFGVTVANAYNGWSGALTAGQAVQLVATEFGGVYQWDAVGWMP